MQRFIIEKLVEWKTSANRKPLILRGARQTGKTWVVNAFGKQHFQGRIYSVDLEKHSDWHTIFEKNLDTKRIISELELVLNKSIEPGKDLLFLDEIQSCPRAIMALRYFYEELPELHVIAAGSLLEFAMRDISFPVGRIQFFNMFPMTFAEFLLACGKDKLAGLLLESDLEYSENVHHMLLDELRLYFFTGGMPECVNSFAERGKLKDVFDIQRQLLETYRADFSKYAPYADKHCLNAVLVNTAKMVGQQIKYSRLTNDFTSPTNKKAFDLLNMARIIYKIPSASPAGSPLGASASGKKFKTICVDIGLMQNLCGVNISDEINKLDLMNIYQGALAEQFVGQELLAAGLNDVYYWSREAKSSSAEVDFLIESKGQIVPIEVKSGISGKLRSMHLLIKTYPNVSAGYVLSTRPHSEITDQKLIFYPLYHAHKFSTD